MNIETYANAADAPPNEERYRIHSRVEIIALLRTLHERHALLTIGFGGSRFVVSAVLDVAPDADEVILDCGAHAIDTQALLRARGLSVVTMLDHVKVQFEVDHAEETMFDGAPALRVQLPESLLRLQRRDAYRLQTSAARPIKLVIPATDVEGKPFEFRICDISCGGVGIIVPDPGPAIEPGMRFEGCRIDLGDAGLVMADVDVRHSATTRNAAGITQRRCGCRFVRLAPAMSVRIQRYINQEERLRRARC